MKNTILHLVGIVALITLAACRHDLSTEEKIARLQEQVNNDIETLQEVAATDYTALSTSYLRCDSMLQYAPQDQLENYFNTLNLANLYLMQFDAVSPKMEASFNYSQSQLKKLLDDLRTQYISDSLAQVYLANERNVADTLHEQILYFKDRLRCQKDEIDKIEKSLKQ